MHNKKSAFFILWLLAVVFTPTLVTAAPLTGANTDVGIYYKYESSDFYYENDTTDANDEDSTNTVATSGSDVNWTNNGNTKHISIGHLTSKFTKVFFNVSGTSSDGGSDLGIKYWNGSTWANLTLDAQTHPFNSTGINSISFSAPADWAVTTISGTSAYYIRLQGTGFVNATVTQVSLYVAADGGAQAVPEFADMLLLATLVGAVYYASQKLQFQKNLIS